jgi:hypothetical protein
MNLAMTHAITSASKLSAFTLPLARQTSEHSRSLIGSSFNPPTVYERAPMAPTLVSR